MKGVVSFGNFAGLSLLVLIGIIGLCGAATVDAGEEGTCDAVTGKCAGLKYITDPPCYFPDTFLNVSVKTVRQDTHNSKVITFEIPGGASLNLPVSSALMMNAVGAGKGGKDKWASYNPISSNKVKGSFDLLVKTYPQGLASKFAGELKPGDKVGFKLGDNGVKKWQYPFGKSAITMVAGGTGIAPMFQALHPLLETPGDTTKIILLYSNLTPDDIMLKKELDQMVKDYPDRLTVHYVVGNAPNDTSAKEKYGWTGEMGWIGASKIGRLAFRPEENNSVLWMCGTDDMYKSLASSRKGAIKDDAVVKVLMYTDEQVWRS